MYLIAHAEAILTEYQKSGYRLTLRQLFYQFVARELFPDEWADPATGSTNNQKSYYKLGDILNDARIAGMIDWYAITDRTRNLAANSHWVNAASAIDDTARWFRYDLWEGQQYKPEVWVEKDAMEGIVERPCTEIDIPYFSCRGYTSVTAIWEAAQRMLEVIKQGCKPVVLHLGDHDPSGLDMSRDIQERLELFMGGAYEEITFNRIALNWKQVQKYKPPKNPVKVTDSRWRKYMDKYGSSCWELDALDPKVIDALVRSTAMAYCKDVKLYEKQCKRQATTKSELHRVAANYDKLLKHLPRK